MSRGFRLFVCALVVLCIFSGIVHGFEKPKMAILTISNFSGVDSIGGKKLVNTISGLFENAVKKQKTFEFYDLEQSKKLLKSAGLDGFYNVSNLCTDADLLKLGKKINAPVLGFLEIDGYNEIKKEGSKKSYEISLTLRVINCSDGTSAEYIGNGMDDGDRNKAFSNAVTQLINDYTDPAAPDPNNGNKRANNITVIGNNQSHKYHLTDVSHLPKSENQVIFPSRSEAEKNDFQPCPICFPGFKSFAYGDRNLEENLGSDACGLVEYYYRLGDEPEMTERLRGVAEPIIKDTFRKNVDYKFRVLDTDEVNAFAAPNGYIYVTKGLFNIVESDDELAFVIAHEMGHIEKKHAVLRYRTALAASFFAAIFIASASKNNNDATGIALTTVIMTSIILKGYSQDQEKEADEVAMAHLKNAGFDYQAYKMLMGKFIDMRQHRIYTVEKIFSTHPTPEKRISHLDESLKNYAMLQTKLNN